MLYSLFVKYTKSCDQLFQFIRERREIFENL